MANERNLTGNRDKDGNLMTADPAQDMFEDIVAKRGGDSETKVDKQMQDSVSQAEGEEERYSQMIEALLKAKPEDVDDILTQFDATAKEVREGYAYEEALKDNPDVLDFIFKKARYEDELAKITTKVPEPEGMMKLNVKP